MQQPRNVVLVIVHVEAARDEVPDHRAGPDAARVARLQRAGFHERGQLAPLGLAELGRGSRRLGGEKTLEAHHLVPLQPAIDRTARHVKLRSEVDDPSTLEVAEDGSSSAPLGERAVLRPLADETPQLLARRRTAARCTDRGASLRASHDSSGR